MVGLIEPKGADEISRVTDVHARAKLNVLVKSPYAIILAVIFLLYLLPALCGFPTWPGAATTSHLIKFDNVWDSLTFGSDHRPIREFIANELWSGRLPLWLPANILGLPLIEQYEYQVLNPLEWLTYLGGDLWWTIVLCGYLFVGGIGVHAICKRVGLDELPSIGGALSYVAAGYAALFYSVASWAAVIPIIPWIFYCAALIITQPFSARHFFGLWVSLALLLLTGQPQIILCTSYFVAFFIAMSLLLNLRSGGYKSAACSLLTFGVAGALSLATAAPQIVPFSDFVLSSDAFTGHPFSLSGWRVSAVNFLNLMFPFSMGTTPYKNWTHDELIRFKPSEDFPITLYCTGSLLALLGIVAAYRKGAFRAERAAYALTATFSLVTIATYGMLHWRVWPFEFVHLARYSCPVLAVLLSVIFGLGLQSLQPCRRVELWIAALLAGVGVATIAFIVIANFRSDAVISFSRLTQVTVLSGVSLIAASAIFLVAVNPNQRTQITALIIFLADATFQIRYGFTLHADIFRTIPLAILVAGALLYNFRATSILIPATTAASVIVAGWGYYAATQVVKWPPPEIPSASLMKGHRIAASLVALSADSNMDYGAQVLGSRNPITFKRLQDFLFAPGPDLPAGMVLATTTIRDWRGFSDVTTDIDQEVIRWPTY